MILRSGAVESDPCCKRSQSGRSLAKRAMDWKQFKGPRSCILTLLFLILECQNWEGSKPPNAFGEILLVRELFL